MYHFYLAYLLLFGISSCQLKPNTSLAVSLAPDSLIVEASSFKYPNYVGTKENLDKAEIEIYKSGSYDTLLKQIQVRRNELKGEFNSAGELQKDSILTVASSFFTSSLLNKIIPHWYGTIWDYNGYTNIPGEGLIACGYFVSTTLKHIGVNVNRFKLAQAYSLKAVKVLQDANLLNLSGNDVDSVVAYMLAKEQDGFYTVGLDNHIGFLLKRKGKLFFIHSTYLQPGVVCIEDALTAPALAGHYNYQIARLSSNKNFIKKWLTNEEFKVP